MFYSETRKKFYIYVTVLRQFHPDSAWKRSSETCMKLTSVERTVENS